jgi:hypothetical protein
VQTSEKGSPNVYKNQKIEEERRQGYKNKISNETGTKGKTSYKAKKSKTK